jgi:tRNA(Ile)-lysidine synthase TilS/MesJ
MRLQFGSGLCGLAAMRPRTSMSHLLNSHEQELQKLHVVRPFLHLKRQDLQHYSEANGIEWVEDPTNRDKTYMRTRMRDMLRGFTLPHPCTSTQLSIWHRLVARKDDRSGKANCADSTHYPQQMFHVVTENISPHLCEIFVNHRASNLRST